MRKSELLLFIIIALVQVFCSCKRSGPEPDGDCSFYFRLNFMNQETGECYSNVDSLLKAFDLDTLFLYTQKSFGYSKENYTNWKINPDNLCLFKIGGGVSFHKKDNRTLIYVLGQDPIFTDTIEFKYQGSTAEVRLNGVLQEGRASCFSEYVINIKK